MTGVLVGVCADRYFFKVDQDIRAFVPPSRWRASVRQVLAHATGGRFRYDATLFSALTPVVEAVQRQAFRQAMATEVLNRVAHRMSVPGLDLVGPKGATPRALFAPGPKSIAIDACSPTWPCRIASTRRRRAAVRNIVVRPRRGERAGDDGGGPREVREASSTSHGVPLSFSTLDQMWSAATRSSSDSSQQPKHAVNADRPRLVRPEATGRQRLVWSFGHLPNAGSALIVKMPHKSLTLILLANSGGLSRATISKTPT